MKITSVVDADPVMCPVQILSDNDSVFGKSYPFVDSLLFAPSPVCFGFGTDLMMYSSVNQSIGVRYHMDSVFAQQTMLGQSQVPYIGYTSITAGIDSVWYSNGLACGVDQLINTILTVNELPAAQLQPDTFKVCAGNSIFIRPVITAGAFPMTGTFINPKGNEVPWTLENESAFLAFQPDAAGTWSFKPNSLIDGNGCQGNGTGSFLVDFIPNPIVDFIATVDSACYPLQTQLVNLTDSVYGIINCRWSVDDVAYSAFCQDSVYLELEEPGEYSISLWVESKDGCTASLTKFNYLHVFEVPEAEFTFNPNPPTVRENIVQFFNQSYFAEGYEWQIDTLMESTKANPIVEFPIVPGSEYLVRLVAASSGGCTDTAYATITIKNETFVYVPNAFTPDGNGINDVFIPVPYNVDENHYTFEVYNRWGQVIFSTNSTTEGWDGTFNGVKVQHGVYPYRVKYREKDGVYTDELRGHAVIVK